MSDSGRTVESLQWLEDRQDVSVQAWLERQTRLSDAYFNDTRALGGLMSFLQHLTPSEEVRRAAVRGRLIFEEVRTATTQRFLLTTRYHLSAPRQVIFDPAHSGGEEPRTIGVWSVGPGGRSLACVLRDKNRDWSEFLVLQASPAPNGQGRWRVVLRVPHAYFPSFAWLADDYLIYATHSVENREATDDSGALLTPKLYAVELKRNPPAVVLLRSLDDYAGGWVELTVDPQIWTVFIHVHRSWRETNVLIYEPGAGDGGSLKPLTLPKGHKYRVISHAGHAFCLTDLGWDMNRLIMFAPHLPDNPLGETIFSLRDCVLEDIIFSERLLLIKGFRPTGNCLYSYDYSTGAMEELNTPPFCSLEFCDKHIASDMVGVIASSLARAPQILKPAHLRRESDLGSVDYLYQQDEAISPDGTGVPYLVVSSARAEPIASPRKFLVYGYGGFAAKVKPVFDPLHHAWIERGHSLVLAMVRGGSELGAGWHRNAVSAEKHRSFEDFISIAETVRDRFGLSSSQICSIGESNGGLLVAYCFSERPDLFAATVAISPVIDLERSEFVGIGNLWTDEYGTTKDVRERASLARNSPLRRLASEKRYGRLLVITSDADDRVDASHGWKMIERLGGDGSAYRHEYALLINVMDRGHGGTGVRAKEDSLLARILYFFEREQ